LFTFNLSAPRAARSQDARAAGRSKRRLLSLGVAAAAVSLVAPTTAPAQAATPKMIVGAVGDATGLSSKIGAHLAYHGYGSLTGKVPNAKMVNMGSSVSYHAVAVAKPGSSTYNNIVRWAKTLKARPGVTLFAYHHEPEAAGSVHLGTAADFIAAWRHVVNIFRAQGVNNVEYTWQMTSWAFATKPSASNYAPKWYPGDSYVDNVGSDPYNWYNCGPGTGKWQSLKFVTDPSLAFAKAHHKKLVLAEFASQANSRRPQWLRDAKSYIVANRANIRAVFYFQFSLRSACFWKLNTSGDLSAMRTFASDKVNFTAS
jgi:glycosyl hydrolase family 26